MVATFRDLLQLDVEPKMASAMGGGVGGLKDICGALNGGLVVVGNMFGRNDGKQENKKTYKVARDFYKQFEVQFGSTSCAKLTSNVEWGTPQHRAQCDELIAKTAGILANVLNQQPEGL
ncbi:MAG: C_GCAxxG_C_C family protein [Candidatus Tectomicrobia bacterium]|uniref:C_GCAxxG_C_C family protein n=1 Tax=Tectimicrobiota bacterium TaxID=2528274 RepID=A0A933LPX8_UNCTE|nr:C_GCAxxG_C_C family protein [Candidatus Tectomicrobia bacterium]